MRCLRDVRPVSDNYQLDSGKNMARDEIEPDILLVLVEDFLDAGPYLV